MRDGLSTAGAKSDLNGLLGISSAAHSPQATRLPNTDSPPDSQDVCVAGVMLLTAVSVAMAIAGVFALALLVIGCWWVIVHIPVPPFVTHLLAKFGLV